MRIETPASRATDPVTSRMAEAEITASGRRQSQIAQAAEAVRRYSGVTSSELARLSGLDRYMLARRLPEAETAGLVRRGEVVQDAYSGRWGVSWLPVGVGE